MSHKLLYGHSDAVVQFVADVLGKDRGGAMARGIGVVDDEGRLVAGVTFYNYQPEIKRVEIAVASVKKGWLTRGFVEAIFEYAFKDLGCDAIVARTPSRNELARKAARRFGAKDYNLMELRESFLVLTRKRLDELRCAKAAGPSGDRIGPNRRKRKHRDRKQLSGKR